jgi:hypothetical protein
MDEVGKKLAELAPADADPSEVAQQIVKVVDMPWLYQRIGLSDLLSVSSSGSPKSTG